jgi:S-adenosyl methyltransferase
VTDPEAGSEPEPEPETERVPPGVDPSVPSAARLYDYYLGGTSNFRVDRAAAEHMRTLMPELSDAAWANRGFHQRAARWMAERGIRQFIDIGSGLPTSGNTHEAIQRASPGARVLYVDNDPMVAAHARDLLGDGGTTRFVQADVRDPASILDSPQARELIEPGQPAGLLMTAVMHFIPDELDPWGLVGQYLAAVAPGSYLALSHATMDQIPPRMVAAALEMYQRAAEPLYPRTRAEVERFFDGLELVPAQPGGDPAVGFVGGWGAEDPAAADSDGSRALYCGVARRS